jgi:hypothetical protein
MISSLNQTNDDESTIDDFLNSIDTTEVDHNTGSHFKFKDMYRKLVNIMTKKQQEDKILSYTGKKHKLEPIFYSFQMPRVKKLKPPPIKIHFKASPTDSTKKDRSLALHLQQNNFTLNSQDQKIHAGKDHVSGYSKTHDSVSFNQMRTTMINNIHKSISRFDKKNSDSISVRDENQLQLKTKFKDKKQQMKKSFMMDRSNYGLNLSPQPSQNIFKQNITVNYFACEHEKNKE